MAQRTVSVSTSLAPSAVSKLGPVPGPFAGPIPSPFLPVSKGKIAPQPFIQPGIQPGIPSKMLKQPQPFIMPGAQPFIPTAQPFIPTAQPFIPTAQPFIPTAQPFIPTTQPFIPTAGGCQLAFGPVAQICQSTIPVTKFAKSTTVTPLPNNVQAASWVNQLQGQALVPGVSAYPIPAAIPGVSFYPAPGAAPGVYASRNIDVIGSPF